MSINTVNTICNVPSKDCRLANLVHFSRGTNITSNEMLTGRYPVVSAGLKYSGFHNKFNVLGPSITVSASGENAGIVLFHNYNFWAADCNFADSSCNIIFAYYFLKYLQPAIFNMQNGAAQPHVYAKDLNNLKVSIPSSDSLQTKIANVLSTYDKLIENNNKRIKLLEDMAESLYKEWFVRFRFPGYENMEFKNEIPKGWVYKNFSDIWKFSRGVSYSTEEIECEEGENLINLKNIASYGGFRRDATKLYAGKYKDEQVVKFKDLIMGITDMTQDRRTVGAVALIPNIRGIISADLIKLESEIDNVFSYCLFKYGFYSKLISQFGNGANVIHLKPTSIKNQKILIPDEIIINKFAALINPTIDEIEKLNSENDLLIKQRDSLLPRLMSGKLEVKC